jgi:HPt (histidine-containing phosphotransfer) domain-containing protein
MARLSLNPRVQWLPIAITVACTAALALLLFTGVRLATRLQAASAALQIASGLTSQPQLIRSELTLIQRGLETETYVGDSLRALATSRSAGNQAYAQLALAMRAAGLSGRSDTADRYGQAQRHWQVLDGGLARLAGARAADLYADSANGSTLTASGARLKRVVDELLATQARDTAALGQELAGLAAVLREAVVHDGRSLRTLLLGGAGLATLLLATMLYFAWRAGQAALAAGEAQRQIGNILSTVREGLFLISRDGRIGGAHSDSLVALLHTDAPAGQTFEGLLRPMVDDKTLLAANKFLGLLWKDKVNEELIESVNPLAQIEVSFARAHGPAEQRFLSFTFRRARGVGTGADTDFVLGVVADITDRVLLQRELEQLRANNESQSSQLLELLQAEPLQLQHFLQSVDVAARRSNALLSGPGAAHAELLQKLQGVFREMHGIKGEAAALGLESFVQRAHGIEDLLADLRGRPDLSGDDFVPVVVRLDELLGHMQTIAAMQEQVGSVRASSAAAADLAPEKHGDTAVLAARTAAAALRAPALEPVLRRLSAELTRSGTNDVRLVTEGLELVPAEYDGPVRDICIQMIRNAVIHGIEPLGERAAAGKPPVGTLRIRFAEASAQEYSLLIEDDGRGLDPELIRDRAVDRGLLDTERAAALDRSGVFRLLFQPGFSTAAEVTEHAGRGVGLDMVNTIVREHGGRIGIATTPGKYTRFKLLLPRQSTAHSSSVTAA